MKGESRKIAAGPVTDANDHKTLQALSEPNRVRIVELLRAGPLPVGEIAQRLRLRQPQASKHLKVLHETGLVTVVADANRRIYSLRQEPFRSLDEWFSSFAKAMDERYDKLDEYLKRQQETG